MHKKFFDKIRVYDKYIILPKLGPLFSQKPTFPESSGRYFPETGRPELSGNVGFRKRDGPDWRETSVTGNRSPCTGRKSRFPEKGRPELTREFGTGKRDCSNWRETSVSENRAAQVAGKVDFRKRDVPIWRETSVSGNGTARDDRKRRFLGTETPHAGGKHQFRETRRPELTGNVDFGKRNGATCLKPWFSETGRPKLVGNVGFRKRDGACCRKKSVSGSRTT